VSGFVSKQGATGCRPGGMRGGGPMQLKNLLEKWGLTSLKIKRRWCEMSGLLGRCSFGWRNTR
jgi:hypothetical protein